LAIQLFGALLQIPSVEGEVTCCSMEYMTDLWVSTGWMIYPLACCLVLGIIVIAIKFVSLTGKAVKTKQILKDVDELLTQQRISEAIELTRDTDAPAANILYAGLERHEEGTERVMKAIENQGLLEMSKLESGLTVLATLTNIAPLLGFLGTVIGMIVAFQSIEAAGEVEATLVAGGIRVALQTTAAGLMIAIPVSIGHNYFVSRIDSLVVDMEESAQKMVDTLHSIEHGRKA
jgi:biopolymer transport protein ExbB